MSCFKSRPSIVWTIVFLWLAIALLPVIVPVFFPWSEINCRHEEINIKTGQARFTRKIWFLSFGERLEDTELSLAMKGMRVDVANIGEWQRVNTFSPGLNHSPNYLFHGAFAQAGRVAVVEEAGEARFNLARELLANWQETGDDSRGNELIFSQ